MAVAIEYTFFTFQDGLLKRIFQTIFELTLRKHKHSNNKAKPKNEETFIKPDIIITKANESNEKNEKTEMSKKPIPILEKKSTVTRSNRLVRPMTASGTFHKTYTMKTNETTYNN